MRSQGQAGRSTGLIGALIATGHNPLPTNVTYPMVHTRTSARLRTWTTCKAPRYLGKAATLAVTVTIINVPRQQPDLVET